MIKILIIVIIAVMVVGGGAAAGVILLTGGPAAASLPTLSTGNQWVYEFYLKDVDGTYTGTLTTKVTGTEAVIDGVACYTLDSTFEPALMGVIGSADEWMEKDTLLTKKGEMSWTEGGFSFRMVGQYSYELDKAPWPREVGKEVRVTETEISTLWMDTAVVEGPRTETKTRTYKVEGKEKVTVAAGEFDCFKGVSRDENGNLIRESWYSDQVKASVKKLSYDENGNVDMRMELKSYSV